MKQKLGGVSMGWRTVVISQHAKVSYSGRKIVVQTKDATHQVPIDDVQILLVATTQAVITTSAITELSESGAKVIFTGRDGNPSCETMTDYPGNRSLGSIKKQVEWPTELRGMVWTEIVKAKIAMQIQCARQLGKEVTTLEKEVRAIEFDDLSNREAVVARKYFQLIFDKTFVRTEFNPINAALNYGYSILLSAVNREIVCNGYLTQFGIHHHSGVSDFNLGSDLMEPFRPIFDYWIAHQHFNELTTDIKFGLIELLNIELQYNGQTTILRNALTKHVQNCLNFMANPKNEFEVRVVMTNEVPNNAIIGHV